MEKLFRKHGLIDNVTLNLEIDKQTFARRLADNVDFGTVGAFSGAFEAFESSKNDYRGMVTNDEFTIRRRKTFFQYNGIALPIIRGTFHEEGDHLTIEAEIKPNIRLFVPIMVVVGFFYLIFFSFIIIAGLQDDQGFALFLLPVIFLHMALMIGIPYFMMKRGVARVGKDLEKDFFFIAREGGGNG